MRFSSLYECYFREVFSYKVIDLIQVDDVENKRMD